MILGEGYRLIEENNDNIKLFSLDSYIEFIKREIGIQKNIKIYHIKLYDIIGIEILDGKFNITEALDFYNKLLWMNTSEEPFRCKFKDFDIVGYFKDEDICSLDFMTDIKKCTFNILYDNLSDFLEKFYFYYLNNISNFEKWYDYF